MNGIDYLNTCVVSKHYGEGQIIDGDKSSITVCFASVGEKKYVFPECFSLGLSFSDGITQQMFEEELRRKTGHALREFEIRRIIAEASHW